ncbi:hypothetical protein M8J77_010309 [Diaphorina citri]|nr:hypothetical protein M8J77_010309 [Diaphorina citri]
MNESTGSTKNVAAEETFNLNDLMYELKNMRQEFNEDTQGIKDLMVVKFDNLMKDGKETKIKIDQLETRIKMQDKEMIRRNLIIYGLEETEQENLRDLKNKLDWIFNHKMELNIAAHELDQFFRMGKKIQGKSRPVLVKMVSGWRKHEILYNASKLAGTKVFIDSDLTKEEQVERKEMIEIMNIFRQKGDHAVVRGCKLFVNRVWYNKPNEKKDTVAQRGNANNTPSNSGLRDNGGQIQGREASQTPKKSGLDGNDIQGVTQGQKKRQISPSVKEVAGWKPKKLKPQLGKYNRSNSLVLERTAMEKFLKDVLKPGEEKKKDTKQNKESNTEPKERTENMEVDAGGNTEAEVTD